MKYWVFQNNQVTGPFEPEDLPQTPGYSGETLICPEGRKGTNMGDWQRASNVPELSVSILKASQLALAVRGAGYPALPPEPTLKDLAALGSLQEKVSLLDGTVSHLQESLRLKDDELLSLHKELEDKARHAQELAIKLGSLEERLSAVNVLREGLDRAVAAEHDVEATVQRQAQMISELRGQLENLRLEQAKAEELRVELARVKAEQEAEKAELQRHQEAIDQQRVDMDRKLGEVKEADHLELESARAELERKLGEVKQADHLELESTRAELERKLAEAAAAGQAGREELERTRAELERKLAEASAAAAAAGQADREQLERTRAELERKLADASAAAAAAGIADREQLERTRAELERKLADASSAAAAAGAAGRETLERTRAELERKLAEAASVPAPLAAPMPITPMSSAPFGGASAASPFSPSPSPAPFGGLPSERPAESLPALGGAAPLGGAIPAPLKSQSPFTASPLPDFSGPVAGSALPPSGLGGAPTPSPFGAPAAGDMAAAPAKKGSKKALMLVGVLVVLGGAGAAFLKLGGGAKKAPHADKEILPPPAPLESANSEQDIEAQKKRAVEIVQSAAPQLTARAAAPGGLNPWFAEKVRDGVYQVNYYAPKASKKAKSVTYEFEVSLADGLVTPRNEAATGALVGRAMPGQSVDGATTPAKAKGRPKVRPKDDGPSLLDNPLNLDDAPAKAEPEETLIDGSGPPPAPKPAARPKKKVAKAPKAPKAAAEPPEPPRNVDKELNDLLGKQPKVKRAAPAREETLDDMLQPESHAAGDAEPGIDDDPAPPPQIGGAAAPKPAKAAKGAKGKKGKQPADAALLDDLLEP